MTGRDHRLIIAESDTELALMLQKAFRMDGLQAEVVHDGVEAIRKACLVMPDLILCGYYLPGLGALRVIRYFRNHPAFANLKIAVLLPRMDKVTASRARRVGADLLLELPIEPHDFVAKCVDLLERSVCGTQVHQPPGSLPDRLSVLEELTGILEKRLDRLEGMQDFMLELSQSPSVGEVFRNIAAGVLTDLGFDRVQIFQHLPEPGELRVEAALGRGVPSDLLQQAVRIASIEGLPAALAVREKRQVRSAGLGLSEIRLAWAGSTDYVDTPMFDSAGVMGVVRCDFHVTGRSIDPDDLEALKDFCVRSSVVLRNAIDLEEIAEAREQTALVLGSLGSAVILIDQSGRIREATGTESLLGYKPEKLHGRTLSEAAPVLAKEGRLEILGRVLLEGRSCVEDGVRIQQAGGGLKILNIRYVPYRKGGRIAGAVILALDVTEEQTLRADLHQRNDELEMLSRIGRDLNSSLELDEICDQLLRGIRLFYPEEAVSILLPEVDQLGGVPEKLTVKSGCGYGDEVSGLDRPVILFDPNYDASPEERGSRGSSLTGIVGSTFLSGRTLNVPDVAQESRYIENFSGTRSEIAVPMLIQNRATGVIDIQSKVRNRFDADSLRRISTLANSAATAVENARLHASAWEMAQRDRLTNLRNLRFYEDRIIEELERSIRYNYECSLLMIDVDDFKNYNDHFGHPMGNILLRALARTISSALRERIDTLVRYGGEEFVCILPLTGGKVAAEIADRIRQMIIDTNADIPHALEQPLGFVSVSIGVSTFPTDVPDRERLLEVADKRMYLGKRAGKNRVVAPALGNCPQQL